MPQKPIHTPESHPHNTQFIEWEDRNKFQKQKIKHTELLYSLKQAAELAGISYKSAWSYVNRYFHEDEEVKRIIAPTMRFPDQTGNLRGVMFTQEIVRALQRVKTHNRTTRQGARGKRWTWTKKQREARVKMWRDKKLRRKREKNNE